MTKEQPAEARADTARKATTEFRVVCDVQMESTVWALYSVEEDGSQSLVAHGNYPNAK